MERIDPLREAGRSDDSHAARRLELVHEVMPEGGEIDEVVRVEGSDHDGIERAGLEGSSETRKGALAEIEQKRGSSGPDEVRRARRTGAIRVRGPGPENRQLARLR